MTFYILSSAVNDFTSEDDCMDRKAGGDSIINAASEVRR